MRVGQSQPPPSVKRRHRNAFSQAGAGAVDLAEPVSSPTPVRFRRMGGIMGRTRDQSKGGRNQGRTPRSDASRRRSNLPLRPAGAAVAAAPLQRRAGSMTGQTKTPYANKGLMRNLKLWAQRGMIPRPSDYESAALTD